MRGNQPEILRVVSDDFGENTYILISGTDAVVIDPGTDSSAIKSKIQNLNFKIRYVLLTHGHYDHIISAEAMSAPVYAHESEKDMLENGEINLSILATGSEITLKNVRYIKGSHYLMDSFEFFHTPGHSAGSMVIKAGNALFTGDTLFYDTVGRTDTPTGNSEFLKQSLKVFDSFDKNLICYPGHGEPFKLGDAYTINYFLGRKK